MLYSLLDAGAVSETDGGADTAGEAAGADQAVLPSAGKGESALPAGVDVASALCPTLLQRR